MEDWMHVMVNYLIMPLFAFANAGIMLSGNGSGEIAGLVTYAVALGLVLGKFVGIYSFTGLAVRMRVTSLSPRVHGGNTAGVAVVGGCAFPR